MRKAEEEELARPSREHGPKRNGTLPGPAERQPLRAATGTWVEAETIPDKDLVWGGGLRASPPAQVTAPQREVGCLPWAHGIPPQGH